MSSNLLKDRERNRIDIGFWTRGPIADRGIAQALLESLASILPEAFPRKWGDVASLRIKASPTNFHNLVDFWEESGRICGRTIHGFQKSRSIIVTFLCGFSGSVHDLLLSFDLNPIKGEAPHLRVLELFRSWATILAQDFGRLSMEYEWITKNVIEQYEEPDGSIDPWMVFGTNIVEGLAGVYWCTYLGKVFTDWLGSQKVAKAPWPHVEPIGNGYLLRRSDSPETWRDETALDAQLKDYFGSDKFFDINDPERKIKAPRIELPSVLDN
jgi:hypothetical protein